MASFNGHISTLIKGSSTGGEFAVIDGVSTSTISDSAPAKFMKRAQFSVSTQGVSGTYSVHVVSRIGGATFVVAGVTGIAADGSTLIGATPSIAGVARPSYVEWASAEDGSGFTSSVFMAGDY